MSTLRRAALLLVLPALLAACSASVPGTAGKPPARPASSAPGLTASPAVTQATSAPTSASFTCSNQLSGGKPGMVQLTDVRVASHPGFDRITFQFAGAGSYPATGQAAVPAYQVA